MQNCKNTLLKDTLNNRENADKAKEQKTRVLQVRVSQSTYSSIDDVIAESKEYSTRSDLLRTAISREIQDGDIQLKPRTVQKARVLKSREGFDTVEDAIHQLVSKVYSEVYA
jgi:hypothetical protein